MFFLALTSARLDAPRALSGRQYQELSPTSKSLAHGRLTESRRVHTEDGSSRKSVEKTKSLVINLSKTPDSFVLVIW